jgi:quinol monooxygenase YgiN
LSIHFFARFEPLAGKETKFREEFLRMIDATRAEAACISIHAFESIRAPFVFAIHSEWAGSAEFESHVELPHIVEFRKTSRELLTAAPRTMRLREIAGAGAVTVQSHPMKIEGHSREIEGHAGSHAPEHAVAGASASGKANKKRK